MDSLARRDMGLDELEAIRLADVLHLSQAEAANMMDISQPTFNRILAGARRKAAECVVNGLALRIESPESSNTVVDSASVASARGVCRHRERRREK